MVAPTVWTNWIDVPVDGCVFKFAVKSEVVDSSTKNVDVESATGLQLTE